MNYLILFSISILLISCINYVQYKLNFLLDINLKHKIKSSTKIPLSGGIYLLISIGIIKLIYNIDISINFIFILSLFFILGYFSDTKPNFLPILRLIIQLILIFLLIKISLLQINESKIFFIDKFLDNSLFNLIFTSLCIIVLLNGSNFVDGVNTNLVGYFIIVLFFTNKFGYIFDLNLFILILLAFYIFNFFGKCFLGDNGVYVLCILVSYIFINTINLNSINPIIAINFLWYPAFENLFSIIRRYVSNDKLDIADKKHLHSILYLFLNKRKILSKFSNSFAGLIINIYNFFSIFVSFVFINNNQILILIIIINIIIYLSIYFKLLNNLSNRFVSKT